jgi:hypothetical protein
MSMLTFYKSFALWGALALLFACPGWLPAQVVINELLASNNAIIADEDGAFEDWIELLNLGAEPVNLEGYGLSDNPGSPFKWVFPDYVIEPGEHLLIWASGKNRKPPKNEEINGLQREVYLNIPGASVDDLLAHPRFPGQPSSRNVLQNFFEAPRDIGDNYGQRIYGWLEAPATGNYTFWVSGDDNTRLFLSPSADPSAAALIAQVPGWTHPREWNKYAEQQAAPIFLQAGQRYYIQALMKEAAGGDHVAVRWRLPNGQIQEPLEAAHCFIPGGALHTNFRISAAGETLSLTAPDGTLADQVPAIALPTDISYGRLPNGTGPFVLFEEATPGAANSSQGFADRLDKPEFLTAPGAYPGSVQVSLHTEEAGAHILYTTDGSRPTASNATVYTGPFQLSNTATVRAVAARAGSMNSAIAAATYNITTGALAGFSSNLPLMIINQFDQPIGPDEKTIAYLTLVDQATDGRYHLTSANPLNSRINIEIRGSSSQSFPKKGYGFHLFNEDGTNRKEVLLDMPAEHNWVLHGPYSDKSLMRNALAYEIAREMGNYTPRTQFVELFLHDGSGLLGNPHYHGVYLLVERIKIAPGRLELAELEPHHNQEPEITGGYIFKKDRLGPGESGFTLDRGNLYAFVRPQEESITLEQRDWLRQHLNAVDAAIMGPNFMDEQAGYRAFIDPATFIDYHLMTELTKQIDGYRLSTFFHKDRNGKLKLGPIWDYNLSWGNADYLEGWDPEGWYYPLISSEEYLDGWFSRLFQDEEFQRQYRHRYTQLRQSIYSNGHLIGKLREKQALLTEAAGRNFQRWPVLGQYVWPNWYIANTYAEEIDWMQEWMERRLEWMDGQLLDSSEVLHYWNFNIAADFAAPSFTVGGAALSIEPGPATEVTTGTGQDFSGLNARFGDPAGSHLRVNNPIGSTLTFALPSSNYQDLVFAYETRRSGSGANRQYLSYTIDGTTFLPLDTLAVTEAPTLITYNFTDSAGVNDNPAFAIAIQIDQFDDGTGGTVGNNRFDNVTLDGVPLETANFPPSVAFDPALIELIAAGGTFSLDFNTVFTDPEGDALSFEATIEDETLAALSIQGSQFTLGGLRQGETAILLTADDGNNLPVELKVRILVYPPAFDLNAADFQFVFWDAENPEGAFPDHLLFLQSAQNDPRLEDELLFAYYIPHNDYASGDSGNIGFPYKNESRTRINGLGEEGISFINTGRGRDLGAALLNVNTTGIDSAFVSFTAGTLRANSRVYHLRLQYKTGLAGEWMDVQDGQGNPVEYQRTPEAGDVQVFERIALPAAALGQPDLFLRWKYYFTGQQLDMSSGARDMLRLDDIFVTSEVISSIREAEAGPRLVVFPNPAQRGILYFNRPASGVLTDLAGRPVWRVQKDTQMDLSALPAGMYVFVSEEREVVKIVLY